MKSISLLAVAAVLLTACKPASTDTTTDETTTKTTTVTSSPPAAPAAPAAPVVPVTTLTQANLDKIQNDMSKVEVEAILGQPTSSSDQPIPIVGGTQTTYNYQSGNSAVTIIFKNDQVKAKSGTFNP